MNRGAFEEGTRGTERTEVKKEGREEKERKKRFRAKVSHTSIHVFPIQFFFSPRFFAVAHKHPQALVDSCDADVTVSFPQLKTELGKDP